MKNQILKTFLSAFFLLVMFSYSKAQFEINAVKDINRYCIESLFEESDYGALKKSTLYFVCSTKNKDKESLETLLNEYWTYTPIVVIYPDEFADHINEENTAFLSSSINYTLGSIKSSHLYLWRYKNVGESEEKVVYVKLKLSYDCQYQKIYEKNKKDISLVLKYMSKKPDPENIMDGILANYLYTFQSYLEAKKGLSCNDPIINKDKLKELKNDTLYITENVIWKGFCPEVKWDSKELMSKYPFPYKFISYKELSEKIINNDKFIYLLAIRNEERAFGFSLFDNRTKECLYSKQHFGHDFKAAAFQKLGKLIAK